LRSACRHVAGRDKRLERSCRPGSDHAGDWRPNGVRDRGGGAHEDGTIRAACAAGVGRARGRPGHASRAKCVHRHLPNCRPGTYTLTFSLSGFKTARFDAVKLRNQIKRGRSTRRVPRGPSLHAFCHRSRQSHLWRSSRPVVVRLRHGDPAWVSVAWPVPCFCLDMSDSPTPEVPRPGAPRIPPSPSPERPTKPRPPDGPPPTIPPTDVPSSPVPQPPGPELRRKHVTQRLSTAPRNGGDWSHGAPY
jgi:hypothetical protein